MAPTASYDLAPDLTDHSLPALVERGLASRHLPDRVDAVARVICRGVLDGVYDETEAREALLSLVWSSGSHSRGVRQAVNGGPHRREDASCEKDDFESDVVLDITEALLVSRDYDLTVGASTSICGWACKRAYYRVLTLGRSNARRLAREGSPFSMGEMFDETVASLVSEAVDPFADDGEAALNAREDFAMVANNLRGLARVRHGAMLARRMYECAPAVRPSNPTDRDAAWAVLGTDPSAAYRSLTDFYSVVYLGSTPKGDPLLMSLWDNLDQAMIERLRDADQTFAHMIAVEAVAPWNRPERRRIQSMRAKVSAVRRGDLQWRALSAALVGSFIDREFSAVADATVLPESERADREVGWRVSRARFDDLAGRAARYDGSPLGTSVESVHGSLMRIGAEVLNNKHLTQHLELGD